VLRPANAVGNLWRLRISDPLRSFCAVFFTSCAQLAGIIFRSWRALPVNVANRARVAHQMAR
jgi:hypothetical protein